MVLVALEMGSIPIGVPRGATLVSHGSMICMIELIDFKAEAEVRMVAFHEMPNEDGESFAVDA